ncbi:MAG: hypothetical protein LAT67_01190 [Balneolales bacterium]|nr:hypothetical protein [Balneolales bacterium]
MNNIKPTTEYVKIEKNSYLCQINDAANSLFISPDYCESFLKTDKLQFFLSDDADTPGLLPASLVSMSTDSPRKNGMNCFGSGVSGEPVLQISGKSDRSKKMFLSAILQDILQIATIKTSDFRDDLPLGLELKLSNADIEGISSLQSQSAGSNPDFYTESAVIYGFIYRKPEHIPRDDEHIRALCGKLNKKEYGGGLFGWLVSTQPNPEFPLLLPEPESLAESFSAKLYLSRRTADAADAF